MVDDTTGLQPRPRRLRRHRRHPTAVGVTLISVAALAISACGGSSGGGSGGKVTLDFTWWGTPPRAAVTQAAVAMFEKAHPTITVHTSYTAYNDYFTKLATQTAGGDAPDVFQMDYRYLRQYGAKGALTDLDSGKTAGVVNLSDIPPKLADTGKLEGKRDAIPFGQTTNAVVYDKTILGADAPKPGWTWSDFATLTGRLSAANHGLAGSVDASFLDDGLEVWLRQHGKALYDASGQLAFTKDDLIAWWQLWAGLRSAKSVTQPSVTVPESTGDVTKNGLVRKVSAMDFGTASNASAYGADVGLVPFPGESPTPGQYIKPSMLLSVSARSKHPKEAAELIDFLVNNVEAGKAMGLNRGVPANSKVSVAVGTGLTGTPKTVVAYVSQLTTTLGDPPPPPPSGAGQVTQALVRHTQDVWFNKASPSAAADAFFAEVKGILA